MKTYTVSTQYVPATRCIIKRSKYACNKHIALEIIEADSKEPLIIASINLTGRTMAKDEVAIKNWSENEGIRECLEQLKVIGPVLYSIPTGYTQATIHECLI